MTTLSLFAECPLPGCPNVVDDPRWPCGQCERDLAGYIRPTGVDRPAEVVVAELAERDRAVAAVYAERRQMVPLPGSGAPPPAPSGSAQAAEYKPGQVCWLCEERHPCREEPGPPWAPKRWICKGCEALLLAGEHEGGACTCGTSPDEPPEESEP